MEHRQDAPRTAYRLATLGYRTCGSDGSRVEVDVGGTEAGPDQKPPGQSSSDAGVAVNRGKRGRHLFREIDGPTYNQVSLSPEDFRMEETRTN